MERETERMKVEVAANFFTSAHISMMVLYLTVFIAFLVALYAANAASQISFPVTIIGEFVFFGLLVYLIVGRSKSFKEKVRYLDSLIRKLDSGESVGTLEDILLKNAPK